MEVVSQAWRAEKISDDPRLIECNGESWFCTEEEFIAWLERLELASFEAFSITLEVKP